MTSQQRLTLLLFLGENGSFPPSAGVTQLVECDLAKVDVAGSNPVSRSTFSLLNSIRIIAVDGPGGDVRRAQTRGRQCAAPEPCSRRELHRHAVGFCLPGAGLRPG